MLKLRVYLFGHLDGDPLDPTNLETEKPFFVPLHHLEN